MRISVVIAVGLMGGFGAGVLLAQRPAGPVARGGPALVDMTAIVQNSSRLKQDMVKLKDQYEAKAAELKKESDRGNKMTEDARKLPPSSPERKEMEQKVLKLRADFELHGKRINDDTREQEAKIVYAMLRELQDELARHAQVNGEQLILRYDPTPPDLNSSQAILAEIQKPIVYQRGSEITPAVLEAMNRRAPAPVAGRPPASPNGVQRK
jgi:Skp family chaperone for outer membrane proteins